MIPITAYSTIFFSTEGDENNSACGAFETLSFAHGRITLVAAMLRVVSNERVIPMVTRDAGVENGAQRGTKRGAAKLTVKTESGSHVIIAQRVIALQRALDVHS